MGDEGRDIRGGDGGGGGDADRGGFPTGSLISNGHSIGAVRQFGFCYAARTIRLTFHFGAVLVTTASPPPIVRLRSRVRNTQALWPIYTRPEAIDSCVTRYRCRKRR